MTALETAPTSPAVDGAADLGDLIAELMYSTERWALGAGDDPISRQQDAEAAVRAYVAKLAAERDALLHEKERGHRYRDKMQGQIDALQAQLAEATAARAVPDELRALSDAATPGPWQRHGSHIYGPDQERKLLAQFLNVAGYSDSVPLVKNADLAISSVNLVRALITLQTGEKP